MTLAGGICGALFDRQRTGRGHLVSTSLLRTGHVLGGVGPGRADALRAPGEHEVPRQSKTPLVNCYAAADGAGVLAARVGGRPALARGHGGDRPARPGRRRAVRQRPVPRVARRRADRRARRHLRGAADGRVGRTLRRPATSGGRQTLRNTLPFVRQLAGDPASVEASGRVRSDTARPSAGAAAAEVDRDLLRPRHRWPVDVDAPRPTRPGCRCRPSARRSRSELHQCRARLAAHRVFADASRGLAGSRVRALVRQRQRRQ